MLYQRREFIALCSTGSLAAAKLDIRSSPVETVFKSPGPKPNGLQATEDGLWILDQGDNRAYLVSYKDGKLLRSLETETKAGSGITFDGTALWTASTYSRELLKIDVKSGKTLSRFATPGAGVVQWTTSRRSPLAPAQGPASQGRQPQQRNATGAHGMEWRDGELWVAVPPARKIYRINSDPFKVKQEFPTEGNRPHGLGWEGKWLWCAESNDNAFYRYDPDTGTPDTRIQLTDTDPLPHGMTIWNGWMWYCDDVGVVCRLRLG